MKKDAKIYFRDFFRAARYKSLKDAEDFHSLFHAIETLGAFLTDKQNPTGLKAYKNDLKALVKDSNLVREIPKKFPAYHNSFEHLYNYVRCTRNDAAHTGVYARNKTRFAIELGLIFETVLNNMDTNITNYMVRDPVIAQMWEPLSHIRKEMLVNSYSYIPIYKEESEEWKLISDYNLNNFLRNYKENWQEGLRLRVDYGIQNDLKLEKPANTVNEKYNINRLTLNSTKPVLIINSRDKSHLIGLLTGFDLL